MNIFHFLGQPFSGDANHLSKWEVWTSGVFDAKYYTLSYPDVARAGLNPFDHYFHHGIKELRRPSAGFDPMAYLRANPDIHRAKIEPLFHYLRHGKKEGRRFLGNVFSRDELAAARGRIAASGLFDEEYYLAANPALRGLSVDPITHYLITGFRDSQEPSPYFSMRGYLAEYPDVRWAGVNPLLHYIDSGKAENRNLPVSMQEARWVPSVENPQPDEIVLSEIGAGLSLFSRFGFSFENNGPLGYVAEAIAWLAAHTPSLTIDPIQPQVSIIIPVYGQLPFVLGCLDSLSNHKSKYRIEIIVYDDASPAPAETARLEVLPWIRYIRAEKNGGFIEACNAAAGLAGGQHIVFLNSDTRVVDGWLDELIGSFELFPKAGLVGSKLYAADGTLQEAGGIYWRDGSAWNYGRDDDPNHPRYCFARRVDFCSGAAIAVPTALWRKVGGFDVAFKPAYCEDADLAFRLRKLGYETWIQPLARVIHYEGKTHGRDVSQGVKSHQVVNLKHLYHRWRNELASHRMNGEEPHREANRLAHQRLLVVDATTPTPDQDSGSVITAQMLTAFQQLGYQVTFVPQHNFRYEPLYSERLQRRGIECMYRPFIANLAEVLNERPDFEAVVVYRYGVLAEVHDLLRERLPAAPIVLHTVDLHHVRERREAELKMSRSGKIKAALTRTEELEMIAKADCTILITPIEIEEIQAQMPQPLRTLVDFPYIAEISRTTVEYEQRHDLMFLGGFAHAPNVDAVNFFVHEVWPSLLKRLPETARLLIVGARAPDAIRALANDRIIVTGLVPELQPWFDRSRIFVSPLRYGAGMKGKMIQALAHGAPSVATTITVEGIKLVDGEQVLVANTAQEFTEAVCTLYNDKSLWSKIQAAGYAFVEKNYSQDTCRELCKRVLDVAEETVILREQKNCERRLRAILDPRTAPTFDGRE